MKKIFIKKEIGTREAILGIFGLQVADIIKRQLQNDESVVISFKGLKNVNINFTCSMIHPIYKAFSRKKVEKMIEYEGVEDKFWQSELDEAINLAANPKKAKIIEDVRNRVFAEVM